MYNRKLDVCVVTWQKNCFSQYTLLDDDHRCGPSDGSKEGEEERVDGKEAKREDRRRFLLNILLLLLDCWFASFAHFNLLNSFCEAQWSTQCMKSTSSSMQVSVVCFLEFTRSLQVDSLSFSAWQWSLAQLSRITSCGSTSSSSSSARQLNLYFWLSRPDRLACKRLPKAWTKDIVVGLVFFC